MGHNRIKIVSNYSIPSISYFLQNENREWVRVSNSSKLSRREYTENSIIEKIFDILEVIEEIYNPGDRGVELSFEGTEEEYTVICDTIKKKCLEKQISCYQQKTKIAVAGKIKSGKTTLIESLESLIGAKYARSMKTDYEVFTDKKGCTEWYELKGIDLGKEYIHQSKKVLEQLVESGLSMFVYCFSTYKVEKLEEELIMNLKTKNPELKILLVLTFCVEDDAELFSEQISSQLAQVKVIPILAKDLKIRGGAIPSFGLDKIVQCIYEGK